MLAPFPANGRGSGYTVHRCRHFSAITTAEVDAIPVLSPAEAETDFERDRFRDNQAIVHGWRVLRFSYRALAGDPASCVEAIIAAGLVAA